MAQPSTTDNAFLTHRSTTSNEHHLFAETLRDWRDPLLHGQQPAPVLLCPRCATCRCKSLKDLQNSPIEHHNHQHHPSCPSSRQPKARSKTASKPRGSTKPKRRALSLDPILTKPKFIDSSPSFVITKRQKPISRIPVRISPGSSSSTLTTPASEHSPEWSLRSPSQRTRIPRLISARRCPSLPLEMKFSPEELSERDSLNADDVQPVNPQVIPKGDPAQNMDASMPRIKKKKKRSQRSGATSLDRHRCSEGRHSKTRTAACNDLSSSGSSSASSSLSSSVQLRKKPRTHRMTASTQVLSSLSDDSLADKNDNKRARTRSTLIASNPSSRVLPGSPSVYLVELTNTSYLPNTFGLTKTATYAWKSPPAALTADDDRLYPRYSIEQIPPSLGQNRSSSRQASASRHILLQRGQTDAWQNCDTSSNSLLTSSCENSTGSASHLLSSSRGHVISISTTKRCHPSLLNQTKHTQWFVDQDGKNRSVSSEQLYEHYRSTRSQRTEQNHRSAPAHLPHQTDIQQVESPSADGDAKELLSPRQPTDSISTSDVIHHTTSSLISYSKRDPSSGTSSSQPIQIPSASTDEDVDELHSHYSEITDRSATTPREPLPAPRSLLSTPREPSRLFSMEYSQMTLDSGVDIVSEQKITSPAPAPLTVDEQSSGETTDHNDLFALSDDSLLEMGSETVTMRDNDPTVLVNTSADQNEIFEELDLYKGYELETICDEEDDQPQGQTGKELLMTSERSATPAAAAPPPPSLPPQFEFKLPSFGEWIDRVFTNFLAETTHQPSVPNESVASSRSSSIVSIPGSPGTINTSSSSPVITAIENPSSPTTPIDDQHRQRSASWSEDDDEHSLNDMSSSSVNSEKVDYDTYIINSNYEKINSSSAANENETTFIKQCSQSVVPSSPSIDNDDQEVTMDPSTDHRFPIYEEYPSCANSHDSLLQPAYTEESSTDDLTKLNAFFPSTFHSKDSALDLSEENLLQLSSESRSSSTTEQTTVQVCQVLADDTTMQETEIPEESAERTLSSTSSEQLIPKEKQTGMYYQAFGSSAALLTADQHRYEWLADQNDPPLRIVHPSETIGDNEDEFYLSPRTCQWASHSCPDLSHLSRQSIRRRAYSLSTLANYDQTLFTQEMLEQIWQSLLDLAISEGDDSELNDYRLRHIIGLSNSYSVLQPSIVEKSRSHNDIFSMDQRHLQPIGRKKSKSFDVASLLSKQLTANQDPANVGLLQGADVSEPFADRLISTSIHSDLESIHSLEQEHLPAVVTVEPFTYVFNYSPTFDQDEYDLTPTDLLDDKTNLSDQEELPPSIQIRDTYTELCLFRPHSLSTIPSSRASQYASSVDSDDLFERERYLQKDPQSDPGDDHSPFHPSDDDHGVIGSEFSSPQSRPLSSIQSRSLTPDQLQRSKSIHLIDIDHVAWEESMDCHHQAYSSLLNPEASIDPSDQQAKENRKSETIHSTSETQLNPDDLTHRLEALEQRCASSEDIECLTSIVHDIRQTNEHRWTSEEIVLLPSTSLKQSIHEAPARYPIQRLEKVSDLEIVKQGKGFKIGYIDRQGTDQRVILTKRIEAPSDMMQRDPHVGLAFKGRKILNPIYSSVLHTNGYHQIQEDMKFEHAANDIEVPSIGTNPKHFDESDMISIDIDGPSTMLNSICESIVITQGSVYSNVPFKPTLAPAVLAHQDDVLEHSRASTPSKRDRIEVTDRWRDQTVIHGSSTPWRIPFKGKKPAEPSSILSVCTPDRNDDDFVPPSSANLVSTRDIALSPIRFSPVKQFQTTSTSPLIFTNTVDRYSQFSPLETFHGMTQVTSDDLSDFLTTASSEQSAFQAYSSSALVPAATLERSADSGILVDVHHRTKCHFALQVDLKSSSSDSEEISEVTPRPLTLHSYVEKSTASSSPSDLEQEIVQLRRERTHVLDLLALNWNRSNIWVELTEAKLNYIIGETDALLRTLSFDTSPIDSETVKNKMHQYEEDMADLTRQRLAVYRERLEDSKKQLDLKIDQLESKKSAMATSSVYPNTSSSLNFDSSSRSTAKRAKSFLSTSAENLTNIPMEETVASHPHLLDVSFLTSTAANQSALPARFSTFPLSDDQTYRTLYRPTPRYPSSNSNHIPHAIHGNLSHMEGLSRSQQAILDETDELVKDSQQLHTESASQFEQARESLLSSETSIRLARANLAASRPSSHSQTKTYLPHDITLAELFKYEQSLAKETARNHRQSSTTTES